VNKAGLGLGLTCHHYHPYHNPTSVWLPSYLNYMWKRKSYKAIYMVSFCLMWWSKYQSDTRSNKHQSETHVLTNIKE